MATTRFELATTARVMPALDDSARLLSLARDRAPDPSVFDEYTPFFWTVRGSTNGLDAYYTRMRPETTLRNYERNYKAGVSYQDSHDTSRLGWGYSIDGQYIETDENDPKTGDRLIVVNGTFFTLAGLDLGGQRTDDVINAIRSGVWRDVSIGFMASDITCNICGQQSLSGYHGDGGCTHIPGHVYDWTDPATGVEQRGLLCWAWVNDGELTENSQVYKGATPTAAVIKAEQLSAKGLLSDVERWQVERRYHVRITPPASVYALGQPAHREERMDHFDEREPGTIEPEAVAVDDEVTVAEETVIAHDDEDAEAVVDVETVIGDDALADEPSPAVLEHADRGMRRELAMLRQYLAPHGIRVGSDPVKAIRALGDEIIRLRPDADMGRAYKRDLIDDTIREGIRAIPHFREEQYRAILAGQSIEAIKIMRDDFAAQGDRQFQGGRQTSGVASMIAPANKQGGELKRQDDSEAYRA